MYNCTIFILYAYKYVYLPVILWVFEITGRVIILQYKNTAIIYKEN